MNDEAPRGALKNWLDEDSKHQDLVNLIEEEKDGDHTVLDVHQRSQMFEDERRDAVNFVLSDEVSVIHNQLLEKIRDLGYEVWSFGQNRTLYGNPTATFVEVKE